MAQVDFDNATITCNRNLWGYSYFGLPSNVGIYDDRAIPLATNASNSSTESLNQYRFRYTGTFIQSGVNKTLYITDIYGSIGSAIFTISPITFNAGDTYDFEIVVDISVE